MRLSTFEMHTGLLVLESASPALHAPETIASLRAVAEHIALVLQDRSVRAQVEELSERNRQRAETLNQILEVSNDLKRHRTLDDLFQSITAAVAKSLGYQRVVLSTYERERNVFVARSHFGAEEGGTSSGRARSRRRRSRAGGRSGNRVSKSFHVRDRRAGDGETKLAKAQEPRRVLAAGDDAWRAEELIWIPLYSDDRLLGCLSVDEPRDGRSPSAETIQALEIFANQAVVAIENARPYTEAREQSIRDSLTGAYNHRHFQEVLQRELGRAERVGQAPRGSDARHRRLQVHQRPVRPPGRGRDPPGHRRPRSATRSAATWTSWPGTAETSSRSSCRRRP